MELLYITNGFPFPLTSGYLRHFHLLRELVDRHEVTLVSIVGRGFEPEHRAAVEPYASSVRTFGPGGGESTLRKVRRRVQGLVHTLPSGPVEEMREGVRGLMAVGRFDAAVFSGKRTFPVLGELGEVPLVVDLCDATSSRLRGGLQYAPLAERASILMELVEVRRIERRLIARGDALVFASARDRDLLLAGADLDRASVVPNGVDVQNWTRSSPSLGRASVVFTGKMDYPPNEHAALYLIQTIMPIVWRAIPRAELFIVGRDPTERIHAAAGPGTTLTGYVDDVRPFLDRASVFAAPLHFGAGIQNKVLEAMAMGVPVVASSLAARGVRDADGREPPIEVADDSAAFAGRVIDRLEAADRGAPPDAVARSFVERSFSWSASAALLERAVAAAVERSAQKT